MTNNQHLAKKRTADKFRIALKRSWQSGRHRQRQQLGELDADTLRFRECWDAKGSLVFKILYKCKTFDICRSRLGRIDQFDVIEDNNVKFTVREDQILKIIQKIS